MPAQHTAKMVIASAKRLIELRHVCLNSSRIAEISVPAWPIPIHHTKLMIAKPHATGCVIAQIPTPFRNSQVTATSRNTAIEPPTPKMANHPSDVFGVSTMSEIFSVTDLKLHPGESTRYSPVSGSICGSTGLKSLVAIASSTLFEWCPCHLDELCHSLKRCRHPAPKMCCHPERSEGSAFAFPPPSLPLPLMLLRSLFQF